MFDVIVQYGPITLRSFNVMIAFGFVLGMLFLMRYIRRHKLSASFLSSHFIMIILAALLTGRVVYIFENASEIIKNPMESLMIWDLKASAFGIAYGAISALYIFSKKSNENFWAWLDGTVLAGLLGLFFIHIGRFLDGNDYGIPTDLPWGITFDTSAIPFITPLHPTQLYSALLALILLTYGAKRIRRTHLNGVVGNLGIMLYSLSAFGIDFLHGVPSMYAKVTFIAIAAISFIGLIHCSNKTYTKTNT